jgi:hypothetical protein
VDFTTQGPQYGERRTPVTLRLQMLSVTRERLAKVGIDVEDLLSANPSFLTSRAFLSVIKPQEPLDTTDNFRKHFLTAHAAKLFRTECVEEGVLDVYPIEASEVTPHVHSVFETMQDAQAKADALLNPKDKQ